MFVSCPCPWMGTLRNRVRWQEGMCRSQPRGYSGPSPAQLHQNQNRGRGRGHLRECKGWESPAMLLRERGWEWMVLQEMGDA